MAAQNMTHDNMLNAQHHQWSRTAALSLPPIFSIQDGCPNHNPLAASAARIWCSKASRVGKSATRGIAWEQEAEEDEQNKAEHAFTPQETFHESPLEHIGTAHHGS